MNAIAPIKPAVKDDSFHRERSRCVDAFASIEECIAAIITRSGGKCTTDPLGAKLESLRNLIPGTAYSAAQKQAVDALLAEISLLLPVRADIVHGRMAFVDIDGVKVAQFTNATEAAKPFPLTRLLSYEQMRSLSGMADGLAGKLRPAST